MIDYDLFRLLNIIWIVIGVLTFFVLLKVDAPYGRHSNKNWGPMINNRFAWFIMEVPVLVIVSAATFISNEKLSLPVFVMACLFCVHYFHRSFIFPLRLNTKGKQMPVVIMASAVLFNLVNGFFLGYFFRNFAHYETGWLTTPLTIAGLLIFLIGAYINIRSDSILIGLRKRGETGYSIPDSFLFRWVSCPNHLGEMLEWLGFALICSNLPAWSFFIWTFANLFPRALSHHQWYRDHFPEYPLQRKAVIPYVI